MSLGLALRAFFSVLFKPQVAQRVRQALLDSRSLQSSESIVGSDVDHSTKPQGQPIASSPKKVSSSPSAARSEAITLLSTLQREARLVDLICEPLEEFSDAQIGAAAREVLKDSRLALDRLFGIKPLAEQEEGQSTDVNSSLSPTRVRLIGKATGSRGVIVHRGWQATKCEMPIWKGDRSDSLILAPTEVEVQ